MSDTRTKIRCDNCGLTGALGVTWYGGCVRCASLGTEPAYTILKP